MSKHRSRQGKEGKIVTAGHSTRVEGLNKLLKQLQNWDEITTIRLGAIQVRNKVGRSSKKMVVKSSTDAIEMPVSTIEPKQERKRAHGGGGFDFRATRWAVNSGGMHTGIKCNASYGRATQEVVLTSYDYPALLARLAREGFDSRWVQQELKEQSTP